MPKTAHSAPPSAAARKTAAPLVTVDQIMALVNERCWDQLESRARALATRQPGSALGWKALGSALLEQGKYAEAVTALTRLTRLVPSDVAGHNNLALALAGIGRHAEAEASYRRAIKVNPRFTGAHQNLGIHLGARGRLAEALGHQLQALELEPQHAGSHTLVAHTLRELGRLHEATTHYRRAIELQPDLYEAHLFLGVTLADLARFEEAVAHQRRAVALRPDSPKALLSLGSLLSKLGLHQAELRQCLERCVALEPGNADGFIALGNEYLRTQELERSRAMFEKAQGLRPLLHKPALAPVPAFTALFLDTPGAGCTPMDYLSGKSAYARNFYCVLPTDSPHVELLRSSGSVLVNMIGDADNGAQVLPYALELADRIGLPVVNHPRRVMDSGREAMAGRLAGTPRCRVPKTRLFAASALAQADTSGVLAEFELPLLVRKAGTHGGDVFAKCEDLAAVVAFVLAHPQDDFYVTEYVDYRSADGFFRKYRFISIDGQLMPYHLAIHDHWMVHHFRTDMANQRWMQQEEEAFLAHPEAVFDEARMAAVQAIARATGLEYCGVDIGVTPAGDVVFFESNATMLVHDEKDGPFVFKNAYIARIKVAFDAMLARMAGVARQGLGMREIPGVLP
jgi:tetratricopeptide (TPR) repeat protein/glutathione synthase/RimK-type ligase-like ATP-grasp enzyme